MMELSPAVILVGITFLSTLIGGMVVLRSRKLPLHYFFAFAAGALIGVVFFDILPEVMSMVSENNIPTIWVTGTIVVAFFFFHILDRILTMHAMGHSHGEEHGESHGDDSEGKKSLLNGVVRACGLVIHSFFDGIAIGSAFHLNFSLGMIVGLAVIFHDFSDGLNTVTVMLRVGAKKKLAGLFLLLDALAPIAGALSTFLVTLDQTVLAILLSFFVGEFLYIGAADLLPEAHRISTSWKVVAATLLGAVIVFGATRFLNL
jgi:zinc transporter ZupT